MGGFRTIITVKNTFLQVEYRGTAERRHSSAPHALEGFKLQNSQDLCKLHAPSPDRKSDQVNVHAQVPQDIETGLGSANGRTTVMLRNVPSAYTRAMLMNLLDAEGFAGTYDFLYLPIRFNSKSAFGYAFVNFVNTKAAIQFWSHFNASARWGIESDKVAEVTWSSKLQGLVEHVERYRNSPVLHKSMPEECKPIILENGVCVPFPCPTKAVRSPRVRDRGPLIDKALQGFHTAHGR